MFPLTNFTLQFSMLFSREHDVFNFFVMLIILDSSEFTFLRNQTPATGSAKFVILVLILERSM